MSNETFASVWDAIEDTPAEAENMKLRSSLMMTLDQHIRAKGWTQAETARRLGVTQPRVSNLLRGKKTVAASATAQIQYCFTGLQGSKGTGVAAAQAKI